MFSVDNDWVSVILQPQANLQRTTELHFHASTSCPKILAPSTFLNNSFELIGNITASILYL